jgi:hypothetical protein
VRVRRIKELLTFSEAQWQRYVLDIAKRGKWRAYHTYDSRRSHKGYPDLTLCRPPRLVYVELKTQKGRLRPEQEEWGEALKQCPGVEYYLWRPSHEPEVREVLLKR